MDRTVCDTRECGGGKYLKVCAYVSESGREGETLDFDAEKKDETAYQI